MKLYIRTLLHHNDLVYSDITDRGIYNKLTIKCFADVAIDDCKVLPLSYNSNFDNTGHGIVVKVVIIITFTVFCR